MTPTTPRKPITAPPGAPAGSAGNGPAAPGANPPVQKKKSLVAVVAVVALIVACVGGWFLWKSLHPGPPLPTAPTEKLVPYVISPRFNEATWDKKQLYLGALEKREDEIEKIFKSGKLTEPEMGMAREAAWLGKYVGRMDKYFSLPPGQQRADYIKKVVDKIDDVDEPPKVKPGPEDKLPKRDKKWGKTITATFPPDVQAQWKEFQKTINEEQDRRKKEKKAAEKAADRAAATKPASNAPKSGPG